METASVIFIFKKSASARTAREQSADSQKNFCKNQKSCIFALLELAEPLNNA